MFHHGSLCSQFLHPYTYVKKGYNSPCGALNKLKLMQKNIELNVTAVLCGSLLRSSSLQVRIQTEITPQLRLFVSACEHAASCQVTIQHCHPPKSMNISFDTSPVFASLQPSRIIALHFPFTVQSRPVEGFLTSVFKTRQSH